MSKALLTEWDQLYTAKTGARYPIIGGKHGKLLKDLRAIYSEEEIARFMRAFFEMDDEFFEKTGWSLGCFYNSLPKVIAHANGVQLAKPSQPKRILAWRPDSEGVA